MPNCKDSPKLVLRLYCVEICALMISKMTEFDNGLFYICKTY